MKLRSQRYAIANSSAVCAACSAWTHVICPVLPPGHLVLADDNWGLATSRASIYYVTELSVEVSARMSGLSPWYRPARSSATGQTCWINHCERCGAVQEDHELHGEPGGSFMPIDAESAAFVRLIEIPEAFEGAAGGYTYDPPF